MQLHINDSIYVLFFLPITATLCSNNMIFLVFLFCMLIHNFLRYNAMDDWLFKQYEEEALEMNEIHVDEEEDAETEENAPRLFGIQEQIYMTNLRDEIVSLL